MSLQVWLPLNGSLENQGLDNVNVSLVSNCTFVNDGKIGKSLKLTNGYTNNFSIPSLVKSKQISIAFWCKHNAATASDFLDPIHFNVTNGTSTYQARFEIFNSSKRMGFWCGSLGGAYSAESANALGEWNHWTIVIDFNDGEKLYKNGQLAKEVKFTDKAWYVSGDGFRLGENGLDLNENDVRIYDHCLSQMEVREIAKGLVLHYPLRDRYIETFTNLLPQTKMYYSTTNTSWDTTKNSPIMYYPNGWSTGYNGGVSSPAIGYHAQWVLDEEGNVIMLFPNLNSEVNMKNRWLGISGNVDASSIPAGTKYTISFDMKSDTINGGVTGGLYYKITSSATSSNFHDGNSSIGKCTKINEWQHFSYTYTRSSSYDGKTPNCTFYFYHNYVTEGKVYVKNMMLQVGDHETGYINGGLTNTNDIIYDSSGYSYNSTKQGTILVSSDTPRNDVSFKLSSASIIGPIPNTLKPANAITMAMWLKLNSERTSGELTLFNNYEGGGAGLNISTTNYGFQIYSGGYKAAWYNMSGKMTQWHHFAGTFDGNNIKTYIDGELKATTEVTAGSVITYEATTPWAIGINPGPNGGSGGMNGWVSDARIYATALSDEDIRSLYSNASTVDSDENMYSYAFTEE